MATERRARRDASKLGVRDGSFFYPMNHAPNSSIKDGGITQDTLFAAMICNLLSSHDFLVSADSSYQPPCRGAIQLPSCGSEAAMQRHCVAHPFRVGGFTYASFQGD